MITLPFGDVLIYDMILLTALRCPSLGNILNLLIAEVAYAISNLPKTIIQMQMQIHQPIIDLYLAESCSVHKGELSISGWYPYPSLKGVLMGLNSFPKRPSNLGLHSECRSLLIP
jgi:hypothetical protein